MVADFAAKIRSGFRMEATIRKHQFVDPCTTCPVVRIFVMPTSQTNVHGAVEVLQSCFLHQKNSETHRTPRVDSYGCNIGR